MAGFSSSQQTCRQLKSEVAVFPLEESILPDLSAAAARDKKERRKAARFCRLCGKPTCNS
jgi:hypothetical protein